MCNKHVYTCDKAICVCTCVNHAVSVFALTFLLL